MSDMYHTGTYLAQSTLLQMHSCLTALELMGCTMAAAQLDSAIHRARDEMFSQSQQGRPLLRPDQDFAEIDAMIDEIFGQSKAVSPDLTKRQG